MDLRGQTAVVTGASSGIGAEFARHLAADGASLVLVARRTDRLEALASELSAEHGVAATAITADLATPSGAQHVFDEINERGIVVDFLVNNAGFATRGSFVDEDVSRMKSEIALNVVTVAELTRLTLPGMVDRGRGAVVNVASTAAFQPVPTMAVYAATKAFVLSFTEALWGELEGTGVRALALCPGASDTEFFEVVGDEAQVGPSRMAPNEVVSRALDALGKGRPSVVTGSRNALVARLPRAISRRQSIRLVKRAMSS